METLPNGCMVNVHIAVQPLVLSKDVSINVSVSIYAVGQEGTILHYDGVFWSENNSGVSSNLNSIWVNTENDIFVAGEKGIILHFDGLKWSIMNTGITTDLYGIWGSSNNNVFAVGLNGTILHYNGATWSLIASNTTLDLYGIWGSSANDIFAVGTDIILYWNGSAWSIMMPVQQGNLNSVWGRSKDDIYVAGSGSGGILHYDGISWSQGSIGDGVGILAITGNLNNIYALTSTDILQSTDGMHWNAMLPNIGSQAQKNFRKIWCGLNDNIFVVQTPQVFRLGWTDQTTHDNEILYFDGSVWSTMVTGCKNSLDDIWGTSSDNIYAVGDNGVILHYNGTKWSFMNSGRTTSFANIFGFDNNNIYVTGYTGIDNTIIYFNGSAWNTVQSENVLASNIWGISNNNIYAVGGQAIYYYNGAWSIMYVGENNLFNIWGTSLTDIFAIGERGTILHYDGLAWSAMNSGTDLNLYGIWGISNTDMFVVGGTSNNDDGIILRYNGKEWSTLDNIAVNTLFDIWGTKNEFFAVGDHQIVHCVGNDCTSEYPGGDYGLFGIWGDSNKSVFAIGTVGYSLNQKGMILQYDSNNISTTTTSISSSEQCPLRIFVNDLKTVNLFRDVRDLKLKTTDGAIIISIYYNNINEITNIFKKNDNLKKKFRIIINDNIKTISELARDGYSTMSSDNLGELISFLIDIQKYASLRFSNDINFILNGIKNGRLLKSMDVSIVSKYP